MCALAAGPTFYVCACVCGVAAAPAGRLGKDVAPASSYDDGGLTGASTGTI